jgi:type 1 fimbriae regulatory protein FimB/type 1 fimbriae regulatory protein FimE
MLSGEGEAAKLAVPTYPNVLRHFCGFRLANDGYDTRSIQYYLRHKNIQNTVPYKQLVPTSLKVFGGIMLFYNSGVLLN